MLLMTMRRSVSDFATNGCRIPHPRSNPSRIRYPAIMTANSANHTVLSHIRSPHFWCRRRRCRQRRASAKHLTECVGEISNRLLLLQGFGALLDACVEQKEKHDEQ